MTRAAVVASLLVAAASVAQQQPVGIHSVTLYPGDGQRIENASVVMHRGKIVASGPKASTEGPAGTEWLDLTGKFVTPGLVDTHVHYSQTGWIDGRPDARDARRSHPYYRVIAECEAHADRFHLAFLASGITAVFDVGGYPFTRRLGALTEHSAYAPHVAATGALMATLDPAPLRVPDRRQFVLIEAEEPVREAVRSHHAAGSAAIKIWFIARSDEDLARLEPLVRAVADETEMVGLPLVVHATSLATAKIAVDAGADLLVHSVEDLPIDDEFVAAMRAKATFYCPTLTVRDGYYSVYRGVVPDEVRAQLPFVHPTVRVRVLTTESLPPEPGWDNPRRVEMVLANSKRRLALMGQNLMKLHEAGVPVVLGTDAGNPLTLHGPSVFVELEAMQTAGLSPLEVLTASTRDAARAMGRGDDLGLVASGRIADLVVLEEDPGADIANMRSLTHVVRAGHVHEREALLHELANDVR